MGRGKLLRNYWPFSPSTFVTIPRSNGGFKLTRNNKLKCVSGLVNSDTFYKAPLIAKCFIIVRVYPANCFEINIPINFCMVINSCISDIFSKKPLTILLVVYYSPFTPDIVILVTSANNSAIMHGNLYSVIIIFIHKSVDNRDATR